MANRNRYKASILGIDSYFPETIVTNKDLEKIVDTNDQWIVERTGIRERRRSEAHETPGFMGSEASKKLLKKLNFPAEKIDLIIVATITGDYTFPACASVIQRNIGATKAWGYDLSAACSGFLYALESARAFVESGMHENVLVVAAEKMSGILDYTDRSTCILFGDAGSATLVTRADENSNSEIIDGIMHLDGTGIEYLYAPAGGSLKPLTKEIIDSKEQYAKQDGRNVYKRAVVDMAQVAEEVLKRNNLTGDDIQLFVPHQANLRIIESAADRLGMPLEKVSINIDRYGNTTAATIPTALQESFEKGNVKKGDLVLLASFGAGFTWGATLLRL